MGRYSRIFGLPRHAADISVLPSLRLPPIDQPASAEKTESTDLLSLINHAEQSHVLHTPVVKRVITPTFFIRESPLPTRGDLDLLRRCLILRTKLVKEKEQKGYK